jgi:hypothetical protein
MEFLNNFLTINYNANAGLGIIFPTKTTIINTTKAVIVISPCELSEDIVLFLESTKKNFIFIAPNNFHNLHLKACYNLFPDAKFYGPKRSANQSGVELTKIDNKLKIEGLETHYIQGHKLLSETCFYHSETKNLIVTDLLFNMKHKMNFASKLMFTLVGTYQKLGMSKALRMKIDDKKVFKESILKLLEYPFEKVVLSHGNSISRKEFELAINNLNL